MEISSALASLPHRPGVYIFRDQSKKVIYVGKAINLSRRVKSYFQRNANEWKIQELTQQTVDIQIIETVSEFDALLLEAKLIHQHRPKYNAIAKDDRTPLYIVLTLSETLPRIIFTRKSELEHIKKNKKDCVFGPFQSTGSAYSIMKQIRVIVPYCTQKKRTGKPCFYTHLGLCNPCPSFLEKNPEEKALKAYRKNIYRLKSILSGNAHAVMGQMTREMESMAKNLQFEQAALVQKRIQNYYRLLEHKNNPAVYLEPDGLTLAYEEELNDLARVLHPYYPSLVHINRIEAVDISNISGKFATASLVVLTQGVADKKEYRRFRIRRNAGPNDTAMVAEVVERRFGHREWPLPSLLVIDGGKGQVRATHQILENMGISLPIIGLAKRFEEIIILHTRTFISIKLSLSRPGLHILMRVRDEAHRFARSYHRLLRQA